MDSVTAVVIAGGAGVAATIAWTFTFMRFFRSRGEARASKRAVRDAEDISSLGSGSESSKYRGFLADALRPTDIEELNELRRRLAQAGLRASDAVGLFSVVRATVLFGSIAVFFLMLITAGLSGGTMVVGALLMAVGYFAPTWWLRGRISTRQAALNYSLPPTLDLLVTCMEAGLGLEQALSRVASEIDRSDPEMAEEMGVVTAEVRAGLSVGAAFRKLADRVTSDDIRNLANVIVQSSTMGASLGRTLREYSASARRRRELALEENAGKVTASLTLPLTLCLFPAAILAMLGPAVIVISESMFFE